MARTILQSICDTKRGEVARAKAAHPRETIEQALADAPPPRDFLGAITAMPSSLRLIAEIKKASPSAGLIRPDFDPAEIARIYQGCGASALSVLTDRTYFRGELSHLAVARDAVGLPVLRKDFIIDEYQIAESRAAGADAVLLIAAVLDARQIREWIGKSNELGMTALVEIHDEAELEAVIEIVASADRAILGINNRDLGAQVVDLVVTARLAARIAGRVAFVSESGIKTRDDVMRMKNAGASALLIGETLMRSADIATKVNNLFGPT